MSRPLVLKQSWRPTWWSTVPVLCEKIERLMAGLRTPGLDSTNKLPEGKKKTTKQNRRELCVGNSVWIVFTCANCPGTTSSHLIKLSHLVSSMDVAILIRQVVYQRLIHFVRITLSVIVNFLQTRWIISPSSLPARVSNERPTDRVMKMASVQQGPNVSSHYQELILFHHPEIQLPFPE